MRPIAGAFLVCLTTAQPAWAEEPPPDRATQLFEESAEHYRAGRFDRAIQLLEEAHRLSGEPVLLFNLAKAHEGKGDRKAAIALYQRYLREADDVPDRGAIERRIATLRAQMEEQRALERKIAQERRRADEAAREKPTPSPIPWVLAGVGVAGLAVGGALAGVAASKESDVEEEPVQLEAEKLLEEAKTLAIGANVAFAVGGALLIGGATWGIVDVVSISDSQARIELRPGHARFVVRFP
ncbi:MAG TPA: tetratricopeptide repeat protein [Polyangiaceae bacterium]|jgi:tetratricopeptide (TPR) repeat protein|nr:tetratricopeptide repeat protein [Polyangiaceae bacterium]